MMRKQKINLLFAMLALVCAIFVSATPLKTNSNTGETENETLLTDSLNVEKVSPQDSVKQELIGEVENYIFGNFPKVNSEIPTLIVENGLENEIDIMFMMAQTQIETQYGTTGAGRESSRRSLFGVAVKKYNTYKLAIEDYIRVLQKYYLTRGRTEQHLMKKYTTSSGARYAANPNYEVDLRNAYAGIKRKTNIMQLQEKYKEFSKYYEIERL